MMIGKTVSIKQAIRQSRLGSCWKCMSLSVGMLLVSVCAFVVALRLNALEDGGFFGSNFFVLTVLTGMSAFALLTLVHLICLVLRRTIWSNHSN